MADSREHQIPSVDAFVTTHWSVVLSAAQATDSPKAREALETLCRIYWYPLYAFIRRQGTAPAEAEDLTQAFFATLLEKNFLLDVRSEAGRFRSFLLAALRHFLINEWRNGRTQKRGGGRHVISLDAESPEERYRLEPVDHATPEVLFEQRCALAVLNRVIARLHAEYVANNKAEVFEALKSFLTEKQSTPHAQLAARLGVSVSAVGVAIHRLRERYAKLLREEIMHTVGREADVDDELRHLIRVVGGASG